MFQPLSVHVLPLPHFYPLSIHLCVHLIHVLPLLYLHPLSFVFPALHVLSLSLFPPLSLLFPRHSGSSLNFFLPFLTVPYEDIRSRTFPVPQVLPPPLLHVSPFFCLVLGSSRSVIFSEFLSSLSQFSSTMFFFNDCTLPSDNTQNSTDTHTRTHITSHQIPPFFHLLIVSTSGWC